MKRFIILLVILAAAFVVAERVPAIRSRLPWLPVVPGLTYVAQDGTGQTAEGESTGNSGGGGRRGGRRGGFEGPIPVLVGPVETADVPITADVLGTIQALNTVTVKSQVDGKLVELAFQDGQDVKKGDVLARIDSAPFQAAYDQAVAKRAQDQAQLANGQADLVRYQKLAATQYGSAQQADTQKAQVAQYQAQLQQDQAAIDTAKTTLDWATIRAPIDGRTGIRTVDAGNIVHASDTTGIVTITQLKPISAIFNLPQQLLRSINAGQAKAPLKLEAFDADTHKVIDTGVLSVVDNTVDQTTGTVKMKGTFPNADLQLWPGQFVNLRLTIDTLKNATVVPTPAIQRGPDGPFVYVLKPDSTVAVTKVTVGRQTEDQSVVTAGVKPPETVVTTGFTRLTDNAKVAVSQASAALDGEAGRPATDRAARDGATRQDGRSKPDEAAASPGQATEAATPAEDNGDARRQRRGRRNREDGASRAPDAQPQH